MGAYPTASHQRLARALAGLGPERSSRRRTWRLDPLRPRSDEVLRSALFDPLPPRTRSTKWSRLRARTRGSGPPPPASHDLRSRPERRVVSDGLAPGRRPRPSSRTNLVPPFLGPRPSAGRGLEIWKKIIAAADFRFILFGAFFLNCNASIIIRYIGQINEGPDRGRSRGLGRYDKPMKMMTTPTALSARPRHATPRKPRRFVSAPAPRISRDRQNARSRRGEEPRRAPRRGADRSRRPRCATTVSGHSLRALKRANAKASKPVVRSGASNA